ncbi:hypothetical protein ACTXT7_010628 [Hymenolepis weldensis]
MIPPMPEASPFVKWATAHICGTLHSNFSRFENINVMICEDGEDEIGDYFQSSFSATVSPYFISIFFNSSSDHHSTFQLLFFFLLPLSKTNSDNYSPAKPPHYASSSSSSSHTMNTTGL